MGITWTWMWQCLWRVKWEYERAVRPVTVNPSCQLIQLKKKKMSAQLQRMCDWSITFFFMAVTPVEGLLWPNMTRKMTKLLLIRNSRQAYTHKQYVWLRTNSWAEDYPFLKCNKDKHNTWSWNDDYLYSRGCSVNFRPRNSPESSASLLPFSLHFTPLSSIFLSFMSR